MTGRAQRPFAASAAIALALAVLAGCATDTPLEPRAFDASAGEVDVVVGADGFVVADGERVPFDAFVLRLRQRTRQMTRDELDRFVVRMRPAPDVPPDRERALRATVDRLWNELRLMTVTQATYNYPRSE